MLNILEQRAFTHERGREPLRKKKNIQNYTCHCLRFFYAVPQNTLLQIVQHDVMRRVLRFVCDCEGILRQCLWIHFFFCFTSASAIMTTYSYSSSSTPHSTNLLLLPSWYAWCFYSEGSFTIKTCVKHLDENIRKTQLHTYATSQRS